MLQAGFDFVIFDFAGTGLSTGKYVTLGIKESEDVRLVLKNLRKKHSYSEFYLWGRSMGASTAIMYSAKYQRGHGVEGMILDSPFSDARTMVCDLVYDNSSVPAFLVRAALVPMESSITSNVGCNVLDANPAEEAKRCRRIPAIFFVARNDNVSKPSRVKEVFKNYACDKK